MAGHLDIILGTSDSQQPVPNMLIRNLGGWTYSLNSMGHTQTDSGGFVHLMNAADGTATDCSQGGYPYTNAVAWGVRAAPS